MNGERSGLIFLAVLVVLWGGNYTWVKIALEDSGPLAFNGIRYVLAALLMVAIFGLGGKLSSILPAREERTGLALIGLLQVAAVTVLSTFALKHIDANRVVLILYSMPIWTLLIGLVRGARPTGRTLLGVGLGAVGLAFLTNPWSMDWNAASLPGLAYALASVLAWAVASILYRERKWTSGLWSQTFWQLAVTALVVAPIAWIMEGPRSVDLTPSLLAALAWNAIGPSTSGYWCWSQALLRVPVTTAAQFLLLSPVYGVFQNWLILGEPMTAAIWVAGAFILAGAFLSLPPRRAPAAPAA